MAKPDPSCCARCENLNHQPYATRIGRGVGERRRQQRDAGSPPEQANLGKVFARPSCRGNRRPKILPQHSAESVSDQPTDTPAARRIRLMGSASLPRLQPQSLEADGQRFCWLLEMAHDPESTDFTFEIASPATEAQAN